MSQSAPQSLLLSHGTAEVSNDPFFHLQVDDFLPPGQYQSLLESFPAAESFPETIEGNKKRLNSRTSSGAFKEYCRTHPAWAQLFEQLSAGPFLADLYATVQEPLRQARSRFGSRPWRLTGKGAGGILGRLLARRIKVTFEFSRLESGSIVPAHTDAPEKLVTMMLYFPDPDWKESYGGGTVFYRPKSPALRRNWSNYRVPFEDLSAVAVNQFIPNRLCIFIKSKDSYHGLPAITCPEGMARNSLNINIFRQKPKRFRRIAESKDRLVQRLELRHHGS